MLPFSTIGSDGFWTSYYQMRSLLGKAARKDFSQEFTLEKFEQNFLRNIEQIVLKEQ